MTQRGTEFWTGGAVPIIGPEVLISIVGSASDVAVVVNPEDAIVSVMVNPNAHGLEAFDQWYGEDFRSTLTVESLAKFEERAALLRGGGDSRAALELNHTFPGGSDAPMQYWVFRIGSDPTLLLLGRDLRPVAALQQQLIESQRALERDYEIQREAETRLRVALESADQAMIFASLTSGRIRMVNQRACDLLGVKRDLVVDSALSSHFTGLPGEIIDRLVHAGSEDLGKPVELTVKRNAQAVLAAPILYRASGEKMLLCRLNLPDQNPMRRDGLGDLLTGHYQNMSDGMLFVNGSGTIKTANDAFLSLCLAPDLNRVTSRPLADFLERGTLDVRLALENAARNGEIQGFATRLRTEHGETLAVELFVTAVDTGEGEMYAVTFRDMARRATTTPGASDGRDRKAQNVADLVGSTPLKDIVAETTDEVEKICIKTAVDMTGNNRVAAAEMLGLSRQSLYVKLRKFGLLKKDG
ncbi:MAG: transcriptional regulator PpsR [Silicimonas sp.]|nr:transcriptional regulator PpsR [Silicimonas sp.]